MGETLASRGHDVLFADRGFTDCHQLLWSLGESGHAHWVYDRLERVGLHTNLIRIPFRTGQLGFRIGAAEVTRRGFGESEAARVGELLSDAATPGAHLDSLGRRSPSCQRPSTTSSSISAATSTSGADHVESENPMCGIAGAVGPGASEDILLGMLSAMRHRGDGPYFAERRVLPDAAIGTNRLGIVDETRGGQPWTTEDGLVSVVLNGEIYNHTELRSQLGHQGPWTGACDTEVLFRAYLEWGEAFVRRLRGMYAIAVLDRRADTLLLARDPLGIKPLYVGTANGTTLFASELKAFVRVGELTRIEELPPGHLRVNGVQTEFWRAATVQLSAGGC